MLGECRARLSPTRGTPPRGSRSSTACTASRCTIRRVWRRGCRAGPYGDYVLSVGRIESVKRVDLIVRAMAHVDRPIRLDRRRRRHAARARRARRRTPPASPTASTFLGRVDDDQLIELYAGALAVVYAPYDEDFGYVTLEAFLARKPVITCVDSGGPHEFVVDGVNGVVCDAGAEAIAEAINRLAARSAAGGVARRRRLRGRAAASPGTA